MTAPGATGQRSAAVRLAGIGLLAAGVTVALYIAGRLHSPNYGFSLFRAGRAGRDRAQVGAGVHRARPGRVAGTAGAADLPEAAAGSQQAPDPASAPGRRLRALRADRADRRALPARLWRAAHQLPGRCALARRMLLLRCLYREGAARAEQAAAELGAAGRW